jgi:type IV pilus assembly protein PilW
MRKSQKGFTLVELLVAMTISSVVMAGIYSAYYSQQKTQVVQEQMADMQQNLRAAMFYMEREIRMAGCDPTGDADAGIVTASDVSMSFTEDIRGDTLGSDPDGDMADPNENITYALVGTDLQRNGVVMAQNIDAIDFVYLDGEGNRLDDGGGSVVASIDQIRSVQITLVARTGRGDLGYRDSDSYANQQGDIILGVQNDNLRRRLLTTEVCCRNLGID